MARSEFHFILDGIDLDDDQKQSIAQAVQEAGMRATVDLKLRDDFVAIDIGALRDKWEWIGRVVLVDELAQRALPQVSDIAGIRVQ
jgi:hypothetical protein